jgi:hypothetical protein
MPVIELISVFVLLFVFCRGVASGSVRAFEEPKKTSKKEEK